MDRVNVARLIVYLRFQLELLAEPFLFEINDELTRDQVKDTFDRFFADLLGLRAIFDFLVVCDESEQGLSGVVIMLWERVSDYRHPKIPTSRLPQTVPEARKLLGEDDLRC